MTLWLVLFATELKSGLNPRKVLQQETVLRGLVYLARWEIEHLKLVGRGSLRGL
jgi:hypothetical protein